MLFSSSVRAVSERAANACRRRRARLAAPWWAALAALGGWVSPAECGAESASAPARAVLVGSSSFNQAFGHIIERELERRGYQVTRKGVDGAGLARPDYHDMKQELDALPLGPETAAVFVYLGVNDAQDMWLYPHERAQAGPASVRFGAVGWDAAYTRRAREFLEQICQRGARRAVVLLPVDVNRPDLQQRLERVRELQMQAAAETQCAVAVRTAGDAGRFEVDGVALRLPDGFHMSPPGARIVWNRIQPQLLQLLDPGAS